MLFFPTWQRINSRALPRLLAVVLLVFGATGANAQWAGENGLIRFSFAEGDSIVSVIHQEPDHGVTLVELNAWLTDVDPLARDGEAFLAVGGFEMTLVVEGAEAFLMQKIVPGKSIDVGPSMAVCIVGHDPGLPIRNGKVLLVTWKVMFQGPAEDVVFRLETEPGHSCQRTPGCSESGSPGLYIGVETSGMLGTTFGAGSVPAYLNPSTEPDLTPVRGTDSYEDVGIFQQR